MHPGTGGVQKAPQPAVPLIPGLQALLAQQAATTPGALQGMETPFPHGGGVLCITVCSGPHRRPASAAVGCLQVSSYSGDSL